MSRLGKLSPAPNARVVDRLMGGVRALLRDTRGVIAVKFALIVPVVSVLGLGSVDLYSVYSAKRRLAEIADAAALAGARELGLATDDSGPEARAQAFVDGNLAEWRNRPQLTTDIQVITLEDGTRAIRVRFDGTRTSFFGNLLPPGGWKMAAEATATSIAVTPLCVLAHGRGDNNIVRLEGTAQIRAPACMVHSNGDIQVRGGHLTAAAVQSVAGARGLITPDAVTGASRIEDPFDSMAMGGRILRDTVGCTLNSLPRVISSGRQRLQPGIHCNGITVQGTGQLELAPGEHWFLGGHLTVRDDGRLTGDDVVLFFDKSSKFDFKDRAMIDLNGRRTGPYAGIVMATTRENTQSFTISADHVESLLGVIYVPSATLIVEGGSDVARESAWTVIVAEALRMTGAPRLFINANYDASNVPVPDGVGPSSGGSRLVR